MLNPGAADMEARMGEGSATAEAGRPPRRARWRQAVAAAAVLVALAGAGVVWWGRPQLGEGALVGVGEGMTWANDGVDDTRMLVRGRPAATVDAKFSIRNEGHLSFTVHGLDSADAGDWLSEQKVTFVPGYPDDGSVTPVGQVTLSPGDEATVFWSLDMRCQPPLDDGDTMDVETLRFRVSWWGLSTTRDLALERPITFVGDSKASGDDCAGG